MNTITWEFPLKTVSESNTSEHWAISSKRHRQQQFFIRAAFNREKQEILFPCIIKMTRLSNRFLDCEENLPMAFKWIKDEIGACLFPEKVVNYQVKRKESSGKVKIVHVKNKGHADSSSLVRWEYSQEKSKIKGIRIEISSDQKQSCIARECK